MTYFNRGRLLRTTVIAGLLLAVTGSIAAVRADDDDWRWREHERREAEWRRHHDWERHWDHHYWRDDHRVYVYEPPPPVYYQPAPPPGISFSFGVRDR